jgi:predicted transcriptional regulator
MENNDLDPLLKFFKVLANENRLKMLCLLTSREANVGKISAYLKLRPPTVSHHLSKLKEIGLVKMRRERNDHLYSLNLDGLYGVRREILSSISNKEIPATAIEEARYDAWETKVLITFISGSRIRFIPAQEKKKLVLLRWLLEKFEKGRTYTEKEVNEIIGLHYSDYCTLRRYLVDFGFLQRTPFGIYHRPG